MTVTTTATSVAASSVAASSVTAASGATKAGPARSAPQGNHFGTDAVYKGYDLMVRKCATHIIREPRVMSSTRADLVRAISSPLVTFAASAADGSILINCPDGLPEILVPLAEPLDTAPQPAAIIEKLDLLDRKVDNLILEQRQSERVSDRLEALEFTLRDRLEPLAEAEAARTRLLDAQLTALNARIDAVLQVVDQPAAPFDTTPLEQALTNAEARLMDAIATPPNLLPNLMPVLETVLEAVQRTTDQIAAIPQAEGMLVRLQGQLNHLADRPLPEPDLTAHHQALTMAEIALTSLALRLDQAVDRLPDPALLAAQDQTLTTLAARLADTPAEVQRLLTPLLRDVATQTDTQTLALTDLAAQLTALANQPPPDHSIQTRALDDLSAQITALANQPPPDFSTQTQALDDLAAQITALANQPPPDLSIQTRALDDLAAQITALANQPPPDFSTQTQALDDLAAQIAALANQPPPDFSTQTQALDDLAAQIAALANQPPPDFSTQTQALDDLSEQIAALANQPPPDFSAQTGGLADLAAQVQHLAQVTAAGPDLTPLAAQYDALQATLGQPAQGAAMTAALTHLDATLTRLVARPDPVLNLSAQDRGLADIAATLLDMTAQVDDLRHLVQAGPDLTPLRAQNAAVTTALTHLDATLTHLVARPDPVLDLTAQNRGLGDIAATLTDLVQQLDRLTQITAEGPDRATLTAEMDSLRAALGQPAQSADMATALALVATEVANLARHPDAPADLTPMTEALNDLAQGIRGLAHSAVTLPDLAAQFDQVLMTLGQPAQGQATAEALSRLGAQIAQLADSAQATPTAHLQLLADRLDTIDATLTAAPDVLLSYLDAGFAQLVQPEPDATVLNALTLLSEQVCAIADRPDPVIDLTAQRQSLARFGTALGNAVQRVEAVACGFADGSSLTPLLAPVVAQLDALRHDLSRADTDLSGVLTSVADQMTLLAHQGTRDSADHTAALTQIAAGITDLRQGQLDSPDILPLLCQIDTTLTHALQAQDSADLAQNLARLSDQMTNLAARPAPVVDLSWQRQDFARFATALADAVLRLETTAAQMTAPDQGQILSRIDHLRADLAAALHDATLPQQIMGLAARIDTLIDRPDASAGIAREMADQKQHMVVQEHHLAEQKQHLADFAKALAELVQWLDPVTRDLAAGPDFGPILTEFDLLRGELNLSSRDAGLDRAFADLSAQVADLARAPEGFVSLAEQRRSFASFSNALAFMLQRLDGLVPGTGRTTGPQMIDTTNAACGTTDLLGQQLRSMSGAAGQTDAQDLTTTLSSLVLRLEFMVDRMSSLPPAAELPADQRPADQPQAPLPDPAAAAAEPVTDPARLIEVLAHATTALAKVVHLMEGSATDVTAAPPASVADLFDRLDAALAGQGAGTSPDLAQAIAALALTLHGPNQSPGQAVGFLSSLRLDFAELVARALWVQTEAA